LHAIQVALVFYLERQPAGKRLPLAEAAVVPPVAESERGRSPLSPRTFLLMAWVANPFAYVAMNAVIPVIPGIATKFALSPALAGVFCSVWMLARAGGFWLFWRWTRWHYRFRWLIGAYAVMAACFAIILLGNHLWLLVAAQVGFGVAVSLIYYSSLYYSMDVGDTKGEHGGFHEAAIGAGIFGGPALGAASLHFFPAYPNMNAWAVSALLAVGLCWLVGLRRRGDRQTV
jgi:predicted MFS family arabinose efflux permease